MPYITCVTLDLCKLDPQQVLVYIENGRNDDGNWEILLDKGVIEIQCMFHIDTIIISIKVESDRQSDRPIWRTYNPKYKSHRPWVNCAFYVPRV